MDGRIQKKPDEELDYAIDFAVKLADDGPITLTSLAVMNLKTLADASSEMLAETPAPEISGMKVLFRLINGSDGDRYKITALAQGTSGQEGQIDVELFIVEE